MWFQQVSQGVGPYVQAASSALGRPIGSFVSESLDLQPRGNVAVETLPDSPQKMPRPLESSDTTNIFSRLALVTLSNAGYVEYTLNAYASLRIKCGLTCVLRTFCVDIDCYNTLRSSPETASCPETVTLAEASARESNATALKDFSSYREGAFNAITRFKFVAIHQLLISFEFVVFTDGDIAFLRPDVFSYLVK